MSAFLNSRLNFDWQIKIAEWNPEKDLLAMVTEDSKILLHRFNWQRLWTVSPGTALFIVYHFKISIIIYLLIPCQFCASLLVASISNKLFKKSEITSVVVIS